jgi:hypothetical protein
MKACHFKHQISGLGILKVVELKPFFVFVQATQNTTAALRGLH